MADGSFFKDNPRYPKVVKAIIESTQVHLSRKLYERAGTDPVKALQRIFVGDLEAGIDFANRTAIEVSTISTDQPIDPFSTLVNVEYPFTMMQPGDPIPVSDYNQVAARGEPYSQVLQRKISTWPCQMDVRMVTLCATPDDAYRVRTMLAEDNKSQTELYLGLRFRDDVRRRDQVVSCPFTFTWDFTESEYTYKFQEYLKQGGLYDVQHTCKINFWDFSASEVLENLEVAELIINYHRLPDPEIQVFLISMFDPPTAESSILDGETGITSTLPALSITFSQPMLELSVESGFEITPTINNELLWDEDSKVLSINFLERLQSNTEYTIKAPNGKSYLSREVVPVMFTFTTI